MQAIILAGGKGTRLGDLTKELPKPMMPIAGKPVIEHQVELLTKYGTKNIIVICNHLAEPIKEHLQDGQQWGANITYFIEEQPLGTVGGLKEIEDQLESDFILFYGDVMIDMRLDLLIDFHKNKQSECTLVVHPNDHPYDSDLVEIDDKDKVIAIHSKPHNDNKYYRNLVNSGAYIMTRSFVKYLEKGVKADFGRDIFPKLYNKTNMYAYNTSEYLKDMGTPDRLAKVEADFLSGKIATMNYHNKRPAFFLDRDGVINEEISFIHTPEQFKLLPKVANAIKRINEAAYLAIVITNQSVIARNMCTFEELQTIHNKMETILGKSGAKLDAIYFCPHHPDKGYPEERVEYKIDCDCRKPKPGMILAAAKQYNIDLKNSFIIGDSERDIQAGKAAGVKTIGVRTGHGFDNAKTQPDNLVDDLWEGVKFIVK